MTSPLASAIVADGARRALVRAAGTVFSALVILVVQTCGLPALAGDEPDPYTATVKVDATADNPVDARRLARLNGQRQALTDVVDRLSGSPDAKLPKLDDNAVTDMVDNFEVANEHMSPVRYLADYTFHFRPAQVRRLLAKSGIPTTGIPTAGIPTAGIVATGSAKPAIVLPVYQDGANIVLWDDPNQWREAWAQQPTGAGPTRLIVPLGGLGDLTTIDAPQALDGKADALTKIARQNGSDDAIVALASVRRQNDRLAGLDIIVKRYHLGQLTDTQSQKIDADPGEGDSDLMNRAAGTVAAAIESGANRISASEARQARLTADIPIAGLGDWLAARKRLSAIASVRKVDLLSLSRDRAQVAITYVGTPDQLKSSLAGADLDLGGGDPIWRLRPLAGNQR